MEITDLATVTDQIALVILLSQTVQIWDSGCEPSYFMWALETWTQTLLLVWQALHELSNLPSPAGLLPPSFPPSPPQVYQFCVCWAVDGCMCSSSLRLGSSFLLRRVTLQLCCLITLLVRDLMCVLLLSNGMQECFIYISPLNKRGWNNGAATSRDVKRKKTNNLIPYNHNVHPPHGQQLPH